MRLALGFVVTIGVLVAVVVAVNRNSPRVQTPADFAYLRGVNVYTLETAPKTASARFAGEPLSSYQYLRSHGVRLIRLNIPWAGLQPPPADGGLRAGLAAPVDTAYLAFLRAEVAKIEAAGMFAVLDLHNGCAYPDGPSGTPSNELYCGSGLNPADVEKVWLALSGVFKSDPLIAAYDLFNETRVDRVPLSTYKKYTQDVVNVLRRNGDKHAVWIEAMADESFSLAINVASGPWIHDPLNRVEYSQHFYPGSVATQNQTYPTADPPHAFVQSLSAFGQWCEKFAVRCSVGEVGWPGQNAQSSLSSIQWNGLGEQFYEVADHYHMDVTYFGASSGPANWLTVYADSPGSSDRRIDTANSQAQILEKHPSMP